MHGDGERFPAVMSPARTANSHLPVTRLSQHLLAQRVPEKHPCRSRPGGVTHQRPWTPAAASGCGSSSFWTWGSSSNKTQTVLSQLFTQNCPSASETSGTCRSSSGSLHLLGDGRRHRTARTKSPGPPVSKSQFARMLQPVSLLPAALSSHTPVTQKQALSCTEGVLLDRQTD